MISQRRRLAVAVAVVLVALLAPFVPALRHGTLRAMGRVLIVSDPVGPADVGVVTETGEAGELEVSDLYHDHVFPRVIVLVPAPTAPDRELLRRGVQREDITVTTLRQLGVPPGVITTIEAGEGGTTDSTQALADWVRNHPARILVVVSPTHARRYRRTLLRVWPANVPPPRVTFPRAHSFHAQDWWVARRTRRDGIFELEKLLWDYVRHPW